MKIEELRSKKAALVQECETILNAPVFHREAFDAKELEARGLDDQIKAYEKIEAMRRDLALMPPKTTESKPDGLPEKRSGREEFRDFIRSGQVSMEQRALGTGAGNTGGYAVPTEVFDQVEIALKNTSAIWNKATILRTSKGDTLNYNTVNDLSSVATIVAENANLGSDASTPFGVLALKAFMYSTGIVTVSQQLFQDAQFDIGAVVINNLVSRLQRGTNLHFISGVGTTQPFGLTKITNTQVAPAGNTLKIDYTTLVNVLYGVGDPYRNANSGWIVSAQAASALRTMTDLQGRPLWDTTGLQAGQPAMLMGFPVFINEDMPAMGVTKVPIVFGDISKYIIRLVSDFSVQRLTERFADLGQVGFVGLARLDGNVLDAGTKPFCSYTTSAT